MGKHRRWRSQWLTMATKYTHVTLTLLLVYRANIFHFNLWLISGICGTFCYKVAKYFETHFGSDSPRLLIFQCSESHMKITPQVYKVTTGKNQLQLSSVTKKKEYPPIITNH